MSNSHLTARAARGLGMALALVGCSGSGGTPGTPRHAVVASVGRPPVAPSGQLLFLIVGESRSYGMHCDGWASGCTSAVDLPAGTYVVQPWSEGFSFSPMSRLVTLDSGNVALDFTPVAGCQPLDVSVYGDGGGGFPGTLVDIGGPLSGTSFGGFRGSLPAGTYEVTPRSAGFTFTPASSRFSNSCGPGASRRFYGVQQQTIPGEVSCSADGWCWESPTPSGNQVNAIWGTGPDDVWAVGDGGMLLHFDGTAWTAVDSGVRSQLLSVWGSGPQDVWAVGQSAILHWDGTRMQRLTLQTPQYDWIDGATAVWGSGRDDVYFFSTGRLYHWNGSTFEKPLSGEYRGLAGTGPRDVWVLARPRLVYQGERNVLLHWNGTSWVEELQPEGGTWGCERMGLAAPGEVWLWNCRDPSDAPSQRVWRRVQGGWTFALPAGTAANLKQVVSDGSSGWALAGTKDSVVQRLEGTGWVEVLRSEGSRLNTLWAGSRRSLWVGGSALRHWDGATWSSARSRLSVGCGAVCRPGDPVFDANLDARVWASGPDDVWVAAGGLGFHRDGAGWRQVELEGNARVVLFAGSGPDDVWAVTHSALSSSAGSLSRWDGLVWSTPQALPLGFQPQRMLVRSRDDAWLAGLGDTLLHWDGTAWAEVPTVSGAALLGVWASAADDLWAVGADAGGALLLRGNGITWTAANFTGTRARAVWGSGPNDVWVVRDGDVLRWDGSTWWHAATFPDRVEGTDVWGTGPNDVWAVGGTYLPSSGPSTVLHWDGNSWTTHWTGSPYGFSSIWGAGPGDAWAVAVGADYPIIQRHRP
ncbi:MAG: hypothetical protein HZB56_03785 [Deltaproteobacteria bacterium]|nr:hypothetical protein [Deltaproteobacteria bacterium]